MDRAWIRKAIPDAAALLVLLAVGLSLWPRSMGAAAQWNVQVPFWATVHDLVLEGPDAGEWAVSGWKVHLGAFSQVDVHRLPTFPLLVGAALFLEPDVALAGHLVNHLLMLLLPVVAYLVGRAGGGPAVGFGAGLLVALCKPLLLASRMYGVDPSVAFMLPAAVAAALLTRVRWWLAPIAGAVAALASLTHYTTLPYFLAATATVVLAGPPGWRRIPAVVLHLATVLYAFWSLDRVFTLPTPRIVSQAISEGVAPASWHSSAPVGLSDRAREIFASSWASALDESVSEALQTVLPPWMPWQVGLALPWLGVLGLGLARSRGGPDLPWARRAWDAIDPGLGLVLLACLAPLPVLTAAGAQSRYGWNLLPFYLILFARGLGSVGACVDRLVGLGWSRWPGGLVASALVLAVAWPATRNLAPLRHPPAPSTRALAMRDLGEALGRHSPPGGGAASPSREAAAHAGLSYCPGTVCPSQATETAFVQCLRILATECAGEGSIPLVVFERGGDEVTSPERQALDAWAMKLWPPVESVTSGDVVAHILDIPRDPSLRPPEGGAP